MKQNLFVGDLCVVDGYGRRVWEVVGYTREQSYMDRVYSEEIIYNLTCTITPEWIIGVQSDTTLVCRAEYAFEYIMYLNGEGLPPKLSDEESFLSIIKKTEEAAMSNEAKEAMESYIYPDTIDGLLEQLADLKFLEETTGQDEALQDNINIVKEKLEEKRQASR